MSQGKNDTADIAASDKNKRKKKKRRIPAVWKTELIFPETGHNLNP